MVAVAEAMTVAAVVVAVDVPQEEINI